MRNVFKISVFYMFFVLIPASVFAQTEAPEKEVNWTLQVDPLTTYLGYVHLQLERKITSNFSLYAGPHARLFSAPGLPVEDHRGLGVEVGARSVPVG